MITASDIDHMSVPDRMFAYADAYRKASTSICAQIANEPILHGWPDAAVVLMLAAHSVELFLKAVLLERYPEVDVWSYGHRLDDLSNAYRSRFQGTAFDWDIPFQGGKDPAGITKAEIIELKKGTADPSVLYRYPVSRGGAEWIGLYGFEPNSFLLLLDQVDADFKRIQTNLGSKKALGSTNDE